MWCVLPDYFKCVCASIVEYTFVELVFGCFKKEVQYLDIYIHSVYISISVVFIRFIIFLAQPNSTFHEFHHKGLPELNIIVLNLKQKINNYIGQTRSHKLFHKQILQLSYRCLPMRHRQYQAISRYNSTIINPISHRVGWGGGVGGYYDENL